jgi:hypothetical protein
MPQPRDADKLESLLNAKQREREEAIHIEDIEDIEDTQRSVTEIEMLKVFYLLARCKGGQNSS